MNRKHLLIILLSLLLTACGSGLSEDAIRYYATKAAQGTPPPPDYLTAAALYWNITITPLPTSTPAPQGSPTMSMQEFGYTQVAYQQMRDITQEAERQNLALTQQANELALEREKIQAEQRAEQARLAAIAAEQTARAIDAQRTAYAEATQAQATAYGAATQAQGTAYWEATATQNNLIWIQSTQEAYAQETHTAALATQAVWPTHASWTLTAVVLDQRIKDGQAREVELAVARTTMTNVVRAWGPWVLMVFVAVVSTEGFRKWVKTRIFKRDEHGRLPVVQNEVDGKKVLVKPDLFTSPVITVSDDGHVEQPQLANAGDQADVTRRQQAIEAIAEMPAPYHQQAVRTMNAEFGRRNGGPQIFSRNNPGLSPVIDEAEAQLLEN
jgi:hypothetical protein